MQIDWFLLGGETKFKYLSFENICSSQIQPNLFERFIYGLKIVYKGINSREREIQIDRILSI